MVYKRRKQPDGAIVGYFIAYALFGLTITVGVAMAILISGASSFVNFIILLAIFNGFSYLMVRGENYQARFHLFMRVGTIIIFLEIILIVGLIITKIAGLPTLTRDNILVPAMIIAAYEAIKASLRINKKRKIQPQENKG